MIKPRKSTSVNNSIFTLEVLYSQELSEECDSQVIDILTNTCWDKLSYPITTYRKYFGDDNKPESLTTIGYLLNYYPGSNNVRVSIHESMKVHIANMKHPVIELKCLTNKDGSLKAITKMNIVECD